MNVCILVAGTHGDVQPFVYLGMRLQSDGHRVRLATHAEYRNLVLSHGLEYYPLGGDPRVLSEFLIKTGGRLLPNLADKEERNNIGPMVKMLKNICYSCYPACTEPDPEDALGRKFVADAIISNPVTYGHIHVAESLSIPLHIMFPQPWSPTRAIPHPQANVGYESTDSLKNLLSFKYFDEFMWLGLGAMTNAFRKGELHLDIVRSGENGKNLLNDNKVPISHMWSPAFVPRFKDWPSHVDVVGEFCAPKGVPSPSSFAPDPRLLAFLEGGDRPIYIGT